MLDNGLANTILDRPERQVQAKALASVQLPHVKADLHSEAQRRQGLPQGHYNKCGGIMLFDSFAFISTGH